MATVDHIVITGMAIEAPGGVESLPDYWTALSGSRDLVGPFPRDRNWPIRELLNLGTHEGWGAVSDSGGFISTATDFDSEFYGITPREAVAMDPQQRVALRVAWRALAQAGLNPGELDDVNAGCFMGASVNEYGPRVAEINEYSGYRIVGTALGAISGRISHSIGIHGPSVTVDTACASSLTALHYAASAVRSQECEWALAGAVCVMGSPAAFYEFAKNNALAQDGRCRAYSADATGTVWAEGAGVLVVEKESRAKRLGHRIYGRVLATGINHNGAGFPIAVPNADAQKRLISKTIAQSGIRTEDIGLIEGHGTGTAVGDPLELAALAQTYGSTAIAEGNVMLGSVKSNLGHAQAASGMLGLLKMLLCGNNGRIVPSLYSENPTNTIDWESTRLRLASELQPWDCIDGWRYGAISSFGVTGTNAHAILSMPEIEANHV
ncbi:MAG: polyketide synthase [Mycobacteriaceae bacterium]